MSNGYEFYSAIQKIQKNNVEVTNNDPETIEKFATCDLAPVKFGQEILIAATRCSMYRNSIINLVTTNPKIALHISIRKTEIIRNDRQAEEFDTKKQEEQENLCDPNYKQPIQEGKPFLMAIFISDDKFHIAIDEISFCTFKYRVPITEIRKIELTNFNDITRVDQQSLYAEKWPPIACMSPDMIFSNDIPVHFKTFNTVVITGTVISALKDRKGEVDFFFCSKNPNRELLLVRFSLETNKVILKAMNEEGQYVNEETTNFYFVPNEKFRVGISFKETQFGIGVGGQELCSYKYVDKDLLHKMIGVKMRLTNGLRLDLTSVEHQLFPTGDIDLKLISEIPVSQTSANQGDLTNFTARLATKPFFSDEIIIAGIVGGGPTLEIFFDSKAEQTIILYFKVDLKTKVISLNTKKSGEWGKEETKEANFDINHSIPFKVLFFVGVSKLFIAINDRPFCTYEHRVPIEDNEVIRVIGMEVMHQFAHNRLLPSPWPLSQPTIGSDSEFFHDIPIKIVPGHVFVLGFIPRKEGHINIKLFDPIYRRCILLIQLSLLPQTAALARWYCDKPDCILKGKEETTSIYYLRLNQKIKIAIGFTERCFLIGGNGNHICKYMYRENFVETGTGGFHVTSEKGLTYHVTDVEHYYFDNLDPDCKEYK